MGGGVRGVEGRGCVCGRGCGGEASPEGGEQLASSYCSAFLCLLDV